MRGEKRMSRRESYEERKEWEGKKRSRGIGRQKIEEIYIGSRKKVEAGKKEKIEGEMK